MKKIFKILLNIAYMIYNFKHSKEISKTREILIAQAQIIANEYKAKLQREKPIEARIVGPDAEFVFYEKEFIEDYVYYRGEFIYPGGYCCVFRNLD